MVRTERVELHDQLSRRRSGRPARQLKENGVEIVGDPTDEFNGKFAWIMDPDGNKVELWEPKAVENSFSQSDQRP